MPSGGMFPLAAAWGRGLCGRSVGSGAPRASGSAHFSIVFCMKVFGEEAEARLGAHVLLPLLGVCRGLPGTPGAWLQLWQTVTFMFLESKMPHFLLGCEPGLGGWEWRKPGHLLHPSSCPFSSASLFTQVHVQCLTEAPPPVGLARGLLESTD